MRFSSCPALSFSRPPSSQPGAGAPSVTRCSSLLPQRSPYWPAFCRCSGPRCWQWQLPPSLTAGGLPAPARLPPPGSSEASITSFIGHYRKRPCCSFPSVSCWALPPGPLRIGVILRSKRLAEKAMTIQSLPSIPSHRSAPGESSRVLSPRCWRSTSASGKRKTLFHAASRCISHWLPSTRAR